MPATPSEANAPSGAEPGSALNPFRTAGKPAPAFTIDMLIAWVIENPDKPYREAARLFGVRPQYIYTITSTDMFKARLQAVLKDRLHGTPVADLHAKLSALLEMSIDKLTEHLASSEDPKFIFEVATKLIATRTPGVQVNVTNNTQNNSFQVDARVVQVAAARERILADARLALDAKPVPTPGEVLSQPTSGEQDDF